jgi:NADH:ubiquinone reductase (H+-translocating)
VLLNQRVEVRGDEGAFIGDMLIPSATVIWAAGVAVPHLKNWLPVEADRTGRIAVGPDLSLPGYPEVFVIGDAAAITWKDNLPVPGLAPAAKQGGRYVADMSCVSSFAPPVPRACSGKVEIGFPKRSCSNKR